MGRKAQTLNSLLSKTYVDGDCLRWLGCKDADGYGITSIKGVKLPAHRAVMSFQTTIKGKYVLHKPFCKHRDCINPNHLYLGDQKQNVQDQKDAGTFVFGSKNGRALLNEQDVRHIRKSLFSNRALAKYYNVSYHTIWDIKRNRSWTHLS